jgi:UDP-2,3-diacylglucosamine pyrophosphatase LpxH
VEVALTKPQDRESALLDPPKMEKQIAALAQRRTARSRWEWIGTLVNGLPSLLTVVLVALAGVNVVRGLWGWATACLAAAVVVYNLRSVVSRHVHTFEDFMLRVAHDLEKILDPDSVRYIVLGHDHQAALERLDRAWYVNTGTWVQVYEKNGPIEGREKLTFFRLAWGYEGTPELLRWDDGAGAPARLLLGLLDA